MRFIGSITQYQGSETDSSPMVDNHQRRSATAPLKLMAIMCGDARSDQLHQPSDNDRADRAATINTHCPP